MKSIYRLIIQPKVPIDNIRAKKIASKYLIGAKYKRIYFYHLRKTGGTSINQAFLALSGGNNKKLYPKLFSAPGNRLIINDLIYVGWQERLLEKGDYYYGFSHSPFHKINIPDNTFTFTVLRDPVKRVISYYQMLFGFKKFNISHPLMRKGKRWLGENFQDFLKRLPKKHLLHQLYAFSPSYDVDEALAKINSLNYHFLTEDFSKGVSSLSNLLDIKLKVLHIRKAFFKAEIKEKEMKILKKMVEPEIELYEKLKKLKH